MRNPCALDYYNIAIWAWTEGQTAFDRDKPPNETPAT